MKRSPNTWKYSAVVLSSLLAVAFGSASQSARTLQDPVHGISPAAETSGDLLSDVRSSGAASPKAERVDAGDPEPFHSNALQVEQHAAVKLPRRIPLPRNFSGYLLKKTGAAGREAEHKHVDLAGSQAKPRESGRRKRWTDFKIKDSKGDNGDHPLPDEPGAEVHCWNEAHVFDVVLPASEVAKHFALEYQRTLSCNTSCVAKVPGRDLCARLKSRFTEPTLETAHNENKQLASFEKNVERRLGELDAKLAQLSLESSHHKSKLVELGHKLNHLSDARKEQLSAALVKTLDSLNRKAAEMEALFNKKSESVMTAISSVLSLIQSDSKKHLWTLKGYAEKKAEAIKYGWSFRRSEKVYIGRYLISWGIYFKNTTSGVTLHLNIQLHKGISDEFLEWPFPNELKLSIIHPESGEKQEGREKQGTSMNNFARPVEVSNRGVYYGLLKFESNTLERNGYVKNDQLLLKLEMFS